MQEIKPENKDKTEEQKEYKENASTIEPYCPIENAIFSRIDE